MFVLLSNNWGPIVTCDDPWGKSIANASSASLTLKRQIEGSFSFFDFANSFDGHVKLLCIFNLSSCISFVLCLCVTLIFIKHFLK